MPALALSRLTDRYRFAGELVERDSRPALAVAAVFAAVMIAGVLAGSVSYRGAELDGAVVALATLWACGLGCQLIGMARAGAAFKAIAIFFLLSATAALASAVLARTAAPLADARFVRMDRLLFAGFDWRSAVPAFDRGHRTLLLVLSQAYASLNWQPELLLAVFILRGRQRHGWRILTILAVALLACLAVFPFCPAVGGYAHFGIGWADVPNVRVASAWKYPDVLLGLRSGRIDWLGTKTLEGIVAMPSFHAAAAIILGWGAWPSRVLRAPMAALNLLMLVSAVPVGGHYLVDIVAGAGVAVAAILLVCRAGAGARRAAG